MKCKACQEIGSFHALPQSVVFLELGRWTQVLCSSEAFVPAQRVVIRPGLVALRQGVEGLDLAALAQPVLLAGGGHLGWAIICSAWPMAGPAGRGKS